MGFMLQSATFQRTRLPLVAIAAFGLGVLAATSVPRLTVGASAPAAHISSRAPVVHSLRTESGACGDGAYVTGDLVGDASPASVYATLCGNR